MADIPTMDLAEFVKGTLVAITSGVHGAMEEIKGKNLPATINPVPIHQLSADPETVQFDVALTVTGSAGGGAKASIKVLSLVDATLGADGKHETQAVSRVKFAVKVSLPHTPVKKYKDHEPPAKTPGTTWMSQ